MVLASQREVLIRQMLQDWDHVTPLRTHLDNWQRELDPYKVSLLSEAYGNYRRKAELFIPIRSILKWMRELGIEAHEPDPRQHFLELLIRDWDRQKPFKHHAQEWQDLSNPFKYQLLLQVLGGRFRNRPIEYATIRAWMRDLKIRIPPSRRTTTPSARTLARWKRTNSFGGSLMPTS